jgi:hypothetical protein
MIGGAEVSPSPAVKLVSIVEAPPIGLHPESAKAAIEVKHLNLKEKAPKSMFFFRVRVGIP